MLAERAELSRDWINPKRLVAIGEGSNGVLMALIEKHSGNAPQMFSQLCELTFRFRADQNLLALTYGVPKVGAVFGNAAGQGIGLAIALHLGD